MPDEPEELLDSVGMWAKKYYLTSRTLIESVLREHDLGPTQWYVLYQLVNTGPTMQRDLSVILKIERATLSGVVTTLVRKGFVQQDPDPVDQRQRRLSITDAGRALWSGLPDPVALAQRISFDGADEGDLAIARRVLEIATQRLLDSMADPAERAVSAEAVDPTARAEPAERVGPAVRAEPGERVGPAVRAEPV